jgi:TonB family protein
MGAPRNRRMLATALALSLGAHLVLAAFVHVHPAQAFMSKPTPAVIIHIYVHPTPKPRPIVMRPQMHRQFVAQNIPSVHRSAQRTHVSQRPHGAGPPVPPSSTGQPNAPGNTGIPGDGGTSGPPAAPFETAGPACSDPSAEAKTLVAIAPDAASADVTAGANVTAMIKVDLDESGRVLGVSVYASTGSFELDRAALSAARESTYAPEMRDCRPVAGSYLFKVEFSN